MKLISEEGSLSFYFQNSNVVRAYTGQEETAASLGRIYKHSKERNIGALTAFRGEYSLKENRERNEELKAMIRKAGYGFIKVKGRYIENEGTDKEKVVDEESFIVIGDKTDDGNKQLDSFLKGAAKKFKQDSVLLKKHDSEEAFLVFYHGPAKGTAFSVGRWRPTNIGPYFSTLKKGKSFEFMSEADKEAVIKQKKAQEEKKKEQLMEKNDKSQTTITQQDKKWWNSMSKNQKRSYLERHPDSKYKDMPITDAQAASVEKDYE